MGDIQEERSFSTMYAELLELVGPERAQELIAQSKVDIPAEHANMRMIIAHEHKTEDDIRTGVKGSIYPTDYDYGPGSWWDQPSPVYGPGYWCWDSQSSYWTTHLEKRKEFEEFDAGTVLVVKLPIGNYDVGDFFFVHSKDDDELSDCGVVGSNPDKILADDTVLTVHDYLNGYVEKLDSEERQKDMWEIMEINLDMKGLG